MGRSGRSATPPHVYGDKHDLKMGLSFQHLREESSIPTFTNGTILYLTDTRALPIEYLYGVGSADVHVSDDIYGVFIQDDWRMSRNFTLDYGLRWDLDTNGNTRLPFPNGSQRPQA